VLLRSDLWSGIQAAARSATPPVSLRVCAGTAARSSFIATSEPAAAAAGRGEVHLVPPRRLYNVCRDVPPLAHSLVFETRASALLSDGRTGLLYSDSTRPITRAWRCRAGTALPFRARVQRLRGLDRRSLGTAPAVRGLFQGIEEVNLRHADLVSVVSEALEEDVLARGVEPGRVVVLPNAVDPERYRPDWTARRCARAWA